MSRALLICSYLGTNVFDIIHSSYPPLKYIRRPSNSVVTPNFQIIMADKELTPPILHGPTAKEKKYDRQLRLWAASGQAALENAKVLLLNSGSGVVGVETLKNLILPGVGSFTIVDETNVSELDLGVNFFLEESSLGRWRAEETRKFLQELNPEVQVNALQGVWLPTSKAR